MSNDSKPQMSPAASRVVRIVFIALLIDLLAFTMPLPLFPRLIDSFVTSEAISARVSATLLSRTLDGVRSLRQALFAHSPIPLSAEANARWDLTLLGGILSSLFSACQFVISPHLGKLSDRIGRRPVLLCSMVGNLVSALLWLFADSFGTFAASRLVGGLSEGNVQLSIAILSDVTTPETRSKSLALVGVAFSLAFTLGPSIGAWAAEKTLGAASTVTVFNQVVPINAYAVPAAVTVVLLAFETAYLAHSLPETRWWKTNSEQKDSKAARLITTPARRTLTERHARLRSLRLIHGAFLLCFSGAEFTLCFLTYVLFDYTNAQNGRLLGFIGVISALLNASYVRRALARPNGPAIVAVTGIAASTVALSLLSNLSRQDDMSRSEAEKMLYAAAALLAVASATVVNALNALASLETEGDNATADSTNASIDKGAALGAHRSSGQLGRAVGPLIATGLFWLKGPATCYSVCAFGCAGVLLAWNLLLGGGGGGGLKGKDKGEKEL